MAELGKAMEVAGIAVWVLSSLGLATISLYRFRATAAGLLMGGHAYANDCALLVPLLAFAIQRRAVPKWLKIWAVLLLTPAPVLLLVTQKPFAGQIPIVGFVVAALIWESRAPENTCATSLTKDNLDRAHSTR